MENKRIFPAWFQADLPDAVGFGRSDCLASGLDPRDSLAMRRPDRELACDARTQRTRNRFVALPGRVHFHVAAGAQSVEVAIRPGGRQRRQNCDHAGMTLQKHFGYAGTRAEVGVYLELPAGVQQALSGCREQMANMLARPVAAFDRAQKARIPPGGPPASPPAVLPPPLERDARG